MATAEVRPRPAIEPIRTSGPGLTVRSLRSRIIQKSPSWTPSPLSPRSLPLPRLREVRDENIEQDDEMGIDLQESQKREPSKLEPSLRNVSLRPITEMSLPSPSSSTLPPRPSPLSAPLCAPPVFRRPTLAEETRNMLLRESDAEQRRDSAPLEYERRQSAPGGVAHARALQLVRHRDHLRRRWMVGSYRPREPEILVLPVELRRFSLMSSSDAEPSSPYPVDGRLTTRVAVHSPGKKTLVLTRTFDLDELRATLPASIERIEEVRRASVVTPHPPPHNSRPSSPGLSRERRHSYGALPRTASSRSPSSERRGSRQGFRPVAIRLNYARRYLPVLAAIMLSEIVRPGDTVELPLPHPRAWEDTVAHVYTGRVALTEHIRQNILYLGGSI
ncbi:uncharacterized protein FTOL_00892 [Fusarium torulosum]|uniref:Uncharacterized protein n=1 Tax=Fusarium torulosum TaxID=33205 RepID=A0AAE8LZ48_9HYPO|nr:uncharacterized protein FTOL_00892 [Fusarium torulosum]